MILADIHTAPVIACAFSGQEHLLSADLDGKILHWRIGAEGGLAYAATLRPADGQPVADLVCAGDALWALQEARLLGWRLADGAPLLPVKLPAPAHLLAQRAGPQGVHLVVANESAWTYLQWREDGWQVQAHGALPESSIESEDVAPDGQHILAVVDGKRALVIETATGVEVERFPFPKDAEGAGRQQVRFATQAAYVYISYRSSYDVRLARRNSGRGKTTLCALTTWALPLVSSPDGRALAARIDGHAVRVWQTATNAAIFEAEALPPGDAQSLAGMGRIPAALKELAPGQFTVTRWVKPPEANIAVTALALSDGGRYAALGGVNGALWLMTPETARIERAEAAGVVTQQPGCSRILLHQARVRAIGQRGSDVRVMLVDGRVWQLDADTGSARETDFCARTPKYRSAQYWHQHGQLFWQGDRYFLAEDKRLLTFDAEGAVERETPTTGQGIAWLPDDMLWTYDAHKDALLRLALPEGEFETRAPIAPDAGDFFPYTGSSFKIAWAGGPCLILNLTRQKLTPGEYYLYHTETRRLTLLPDVYWPESSVDGRHFGLARFPGQWAIHDALNMDAGPLLTWRDVEGGHLWRVTQIVPRLETGRIFGEDGNHNRVIVWDTEGHVLAERHGHPDYIRGIVPAADGHGCLAWDQEGTFRYWTI